MCVKSHELWNLLECKAKEEDPNTVSVFTGAVWQVCEYGIDLSSTIRDTFRTYTLHNKRHICNVMTNMLKLMGTLKSNLTRNECAMLIMAACCHDIGMSVTDEEKAYLKGCPDCMQTYLEKHPSDYNIAFQNGLCGEVNITDEILRHYIRANHHKRVYEQLQNIVWPEALGCCISIGDLISVCQSHGEDATAINQLPRVEPNLDLLFCAVLLRLGDLLDFDATRAPDTLFRYINLARLDGIENEISRAEWQKHQESRGFTISAYDQNILLYRAECTNIRVEQSIVSYLDWVDTELTACGKLIRYMEPRWRTLMLPGQVQREITSRGYLSGEYKLTLDQERVLNLLVGRELYSDPTVFVRELIQNAIDAVRTRKQLDKNRPSNWKPQINIRTWVDDEGFHWFRIEDNGIGMTEQTIREYFLKVGRSYYNSDQFRADKIRCGADLNYKPISQFGIGILSCFMSDPKNNRVEVTTKHFMEDGKRYPAYRLSIQGINGYYYVANDEEHRTMAIEMPDHPKNSKNSQAFIANPGTIIAVRSNPYRTGGIQGFKAIIDKYVLYPEVPIHYEGIEGVFDYKTEQDFVTAIEEFTPRNEDGIYRPVERIPLPEQFFLELHQKCPDLIWEEKPWIAVYCLPLHYFTNGNPFIQGAFVFARVEGGKINWQLPGLEEKYFPQITIWIHSEDYNYTPQIDAQFMLSSDAYDSLKKNILPALKRELKQLDISLDLDVNSYSSTYDIFSVASKVNYQGELRSAIRAYDITRLKGSSYLFPELFKQLPWFEDWFSQHIPKSYYGTCSRVFDSDVCIISHNGIYAGMHHDVVFREHMISYFILMLKDDYCPTFNLSRNHIQSLPLEVTCSLDLLAERICYSLKLSRLKLYRNNILRPIRDYWNILKSPQFPLSNLHFMTNLGLLTLLDIESALETQEKIQLEEQINANFYIVVLLLHFDLRISFSQWDRTTIYIVGKRNAVIPEQLLAFPPSLFMPPLTGDNTKMSIYEDDDSCMPYNALHPFSEWIIKNRAVLQNSVPGIYNQMIGQLQDGKNLIKNINTSLAHLRQVPNLGIEIPKDLTIDDFTVFKGIVEYLV